VLLHVSLRNGKFNLFIGLICLMVCFTISLFRCFIVFAFSHNIMNYEIFHLSFFQKLKTVYNNNIIGNKIFGFFMKKVFVSLDQKRHLKNGY
jgi:hypothetical protein